MGTQEDERPKGTAQESATDRLRLVMGKARLARVRGGVGSLVLVDRDVVAPSNINRQAVAY